MGNIEIDRREYLKGLLVYFPELWEGKAAEKTHLEGLNSFLEDGDDKIISGISHEEVYEAREKVFDKFKSDYPVGF